LARPLKDATAKALREKAKYALRRKSERSVDGQEEQNELVMLGSQSPMAETIKLMVMTLVIDQWLEQKAADKNKKRLDRRAGLVV
jgi:uncharacterized membrane protein (DUF106 family)